MIDPALSIRPRRAVILFVRDERSESLAKPLPGRYRAAGYAAINRRVVDRLRGLFAAAADLVIVGERSLETASHLLPQRGCSFGERIANAIIDTGSLGYEEIVVIGNDCPTITPHDVLGAFERLRSGATVVAAPASDGGAFLIAARPGVLDIAQFLALPWCTSRLFASLTALPGADALPIVRSDFDSWNELSAQRALSLLFGHYLEEPLHALPPSPLPSVARRKALTRIFLTAPPLR